MKQNLRMLVHRVFELCPFDLANRFLFGVKDSNDFINGVDCDKSLVIFGDSVFEECIVDHSVESIPSGILCALDLPTDSARTASRFVER